MNTENKEKAKAFFNREETANEIHFTSDGNSFYAEHYATEWARGLENKDVESFYRETIDVEAITPTAETEGEDTADGDTSTTDETKQNEGKERRRLVRMYVELFDKKPAAKISLDELKKLVDDEFERQEKQKAEEAVAPTTTEVNDTTEANNTTETEQV